MSVLKTHDLEDIVAVTPGGDESPGNMVRHVDDKASFGTVVAHDPRKQGFSQQPQVTVLWSREPVLVNVSVQQINSKPRPLRAKWSVSKEEPTIYGGSPDFFNSKLFNQPKFEGEEEYGPGELDRDQVEELSREGDVTFHMDGGVTVKRRAAEPPEYLRDAHGNITSRYFRR